MHAHGSSGVPVTAALVLLIHSDSAAQDLIVDELQDEFEFVQARNGEQALRLVDRRLPAVAVIETDLVDRATQLYAQLQAKGDIRAVFMVDSGEPRDALTLTGLGTVLPKAADLDRLRHAIRRMVRLQAMSAGVERLRSNTGRLPDTEAPRSPPRRRDRTDPAPPIVTTREERGDRTDRPPNLSERPGADRPLSERPRHHSVPPPPDEPHRRK
jgi:DNA-binding response OmpR family regulator